MWPDFPFVTFLWSGWWPRWPVVLGVSTMTISGPALICYLSLASLDLSVSQSSQLALAILPGQILIPLTIWACRRPLAWLAKSKPK